MDKDEVQKNLPSFTRAAEVRASSFNEDDHTIDLVWSTGATVRRYDWWDERYYDETLDMDPKSIRLERLNAGAPLLDSHRSWSLDTVIGSVVPGTARIENGEGLATVQLSRAPKDADTVQKIRDGIVRNISVGYRIHKIEKTRAESRDDVDQWRIVDWEPLEISAVPIPADAQSQFRSAPDEKEPTFSCVFIEARSEKAADNTETIMTEEEKRAAEAAAAAERAAPAPVAEVKEASSAPKPVAVETPEARSAEPATTHEDIVRATNEAIRAERERAATIRELGASVGAAKFAEEHALAGTNVESFRTMLLEHLAEQQRKGPQIQSTGPAHISVSPVAPERRDAAIENAILHRADPNGFELTDDGRDFRSMELMDVARFLVDGAGINTRHMSKQELLVSALTLNTRGGLHSTSDFAVILSGVVNKSLRAAYEAAGQTFRPLVRVVSVSDFKAVTRAQLGEAPSLERVNEHGEFTRGTIKDAGETYKVETFGRIIGLTRQVIINDDLEALTRIPRAFGQQAAQLESDLVWGEILANRVMSDGKALFHADHGNLGTAGSIDVAKVSAGRTAMAKQTGLDGKTVLNVRPTYMLVPTELETEAEKFVNQIYATKTADVVPASLKSLTPISEPRLSSGIARFGLTGSATGWYLAASPAQIDTIELAYLDGQQGVYTETRQGFDVDGVEVKARLDVGAKVIDHRAFYKVPGSGT